jgi:hypothetical protein
MEWNVIEPARIVASGKIKTGFASVKNNIAFWNDLHHLGLNHIRERSNGATWTVGNSVMAVRGSGDQTSEIHLLVAHRSSDYRWFYGLQPDAIVYDCWNRFVQFWSYDLLDTSYRRIYRPLAKVSLDIQELAWRDDVSEYYVAARIGHVIDERYDHPKNANQLAEYRRKIQNEIEQAKAFKREQDALADLTPDQLAESFLNLVPWVEPLTSPRATPSADEEASFKRTDGAAESQDPVPLRRGGPLPTPEEDKVKIVAEWLAVQGKETQEDFSNRKGVATSTLRA